jgi:hypothetical protein
MVLKKAAPFIGLKDFHDLLLWRKGIGIGLTRHRYARLPSLRLWRKEGGKRMFVFVKDSLKPVAPG